MSLIIGVDHGYGFIKTPTDMFPAGVDELPHSPFAPRGALEYQGRYYTVGASRKAFDLAKTADDAYFLMTLAAIAIEMRIRKAGEAGDVHLAVGLPLTRFAAEKEEFRKYLMPKGTIRFTYEGIKYAIRITNVSVFPQGFSAYFGTNWENRVPSFYLVDVGSWTVDAMRIDHDNPVPTTFRSWYGGMIRCIEETQAQIRAETGIEVSEVQVTGCIRGLEAYLPENVTAIVRRQVSAYTKRLIGTLMEGGCDLRVQPCMFIGGGAAVIRKDILERTEFRHCVFAPDPRLNARGYERLAKRAMGVEGVGGREEGQPATGKA